MIAVEALVRWHHPERGLLHPAEFLGEAENRGIMDAIDEWVVGEACVQGMIWAQEGLPPFRIAINLSAAALRRPDFEETVRHHLGGIDLALLVAALEEGALVTTGERVTARELLDALPVLGESTLYDDICDRVGARTEGERASAVELALEGLYLARRIAKDSADGETVYG